MPWGRTLSFPMTEAQTGIVLIGVDVLSGILCSGGKVFLDEAISEKVTSSYSKGMVTLTLKNDASMLVVISKL